MFRQSCEHEIRPRSVGYIKGNARMCTCLYICSMFLASKVDSSKILPDILASLQNIYVAVPHCHNVRDETVMHFKSYCQCVTRETPLIFTWIGTLRNRPTFPPAYACRHWHPCRTTTLEGVTVHASVVTNDSKATVSVLYWYGNYPTH